MSPPTTTTSGHRQQQQQSENIGDIAKFLEMDNPDSDLEEEDEEEFRGFPAPLQQPVEKVFPKSCERFLLCYNNSYMHIA